MDGTPASQSRPDAYEHFEGWSRPEIAGDDRAALQRFPAKYRSNRIRDHSSALSMMSSRSRAAAKRFDHHSAPEILKLSLNQSHNDSKNHCGRNPEHAHAETF